MNLLDSLLENNSIKVGMKAKDWKEAIAKSVQPLIESKAVMASYVDAIIDSTKEFGPYYIITDGLAMPHSKAGVGVNKDCFSLVTLAEPIKFDGDEREVKVLITLAATSADIHTAKALPQVVALFEEQANVEKIANAKTEKEIIEIIKGVDINKYLQ